MIPLQGSGVKRKLHFQGLSNCTTTIMENYTGVVSTFQYLFLYSIFPPTEYITKSVLIPACGRQARHLRSIQVKIFYGKLSFMNHNHKTFTPMQNLSISIPKPCHEDWGKMTPEERGRFCSKCSKTVLDFSNKTTNEIHQYVLAHQDEKMCGRFRNDQLNQPMAIQIPAQSGYCTLSPLQMFLVAALIVFGSSLFSCTPPQEHYATTGIMVSDMTDQIVMVTDDFPGKTDSVPSKTLPPVKQEISEKTEDIEIMGELIAEPDTIFETLPTVEVEATKVPLMCHSLALVGLIAIQVIPDTNFKNDSIGVAENKNENRETTEEDFSSRIYPNPTGGLLNVEIETGKEDFVQADLYDLAGRFVNNLFTKQIMQPGRSSLQFNISNQPHGIYLLKIVTGNKTRTEKIVLEKR
jgi:type IX secretion system substrate protein